MQVILSGNKNILKLLSHNIHCNENSICRPSSFLLQLETDGLLLLHNTLTGELAALSPAEKEVFSRLPAFYCPELKELIEHHFVIADEDASKESVIVEQLRALFLQSRESDGVIDRYNILPTTACNARCFYCYQSDMPHISMSPETADRLADFIAAHHGGKKVSLAWFGGEPTLGRKRIGQICGRLRDAGIEYESSMVSNAYLFDADLVKTAKEDWHLKTIQITLDGTEQTYIRTKQYVDIQDNPYERVLRNIALFLAEGVKVSVRLNLDQHNGADLKDLIEELSGRFGANELFHVYVWRLEEDTGYQPIHHTQAEWEKVQQQWIALQKLLETKGWMQVRADRLPSLKAYSCMADDPHIIQCAPDGTLSKCENQIFEHTVGSLEEGIISDEEILWWKEREVHEQCRTCPLLPSCELLLKHCTAEYKICFEERKARTIQSSHELMRKTYLAHKEQMNK